ncbi:MAG TPA: MFS transporter [Burkholderiales bacterium]|nr:MFS transporter [Burkholderiales bacterium]HUY01813.1 MFS transporter [Rhodocyclaceae bacterium]
MDATFNVQGFIEQEKFSRFQFMVVALCALVVLLDGFDTQAIGYVAPAIVKALLIERSALAGVFAAGLTGLMIGALTLGPAADRYGRKPLLVFCILFFGIFSLLTVTADTVGSLMMFRFVAGLGLGGAMPNAIALTAEYTPHRIRTTTVMVMFCGFSLGAALGGVAAASLIAHFGWKSVFVIGGVAPLLAFIVLLALLPESIRYLTLKGGQEAKIAAILGRIKPGVAIPARPRFVVDEHKDEGFMVGQLFKQGRALMTVLLWLVFFMSLLELYFLSSWLPLMLHDSGVAFGSSVMITAMLQVGGVVGTLALGRIFDRHAPFKALGWVYLGAAAFVFLISLVVSSVPLLFVTVFGAGFCVVGAQGAANALTAGSYPTAIRSTGTGWALGIGRLGSITGPVIGGALLAMHWPFTQIFMVASLPVLVAACAAFLIFLQRREQHQSLGAVTSLVAARAAEHVAR